MGNSVAKRVVFVQSTDPLCFPFEVNVYGDNPTCADLMNAIIKKQRKLHSVEFGYEPPVRLFPPLAGNPPHNFRNPFKFVDPIPLDAGNSAANPFFFSSSIELIKRAMIIIVKKWIKSNGNNGSCDELDTALRMLEA